MDGINSNIVEWGVAGRPMPGETLSGDLHLVRPVDQGALIAVADGLGHGKAAADAARLALSVVEECGSDPLVRVLERCSQRLRQTRGVVMSLALLNALDNTMEWLGVGNVEGLLVRSAADGKRTNESLMLSPGVLGARLPPLRTAALKVAPGDTLIFATDGIRHGFGAEMSFFATPDKTAQAILARDFLGTDDALVLIATYQGRPR